MLLAVEAVVFLVVVVVFLGVVLKVIRRIFHSNDIHFAKQPSALSSAREFDGVDVDF